MTAELFESLHRTISERMPSWVDAWPGDLTAGCDHRRFTVGRLSSLLRRFHLQTQLLMRAVVLMRAVGGLMLMPNSTVSSRSLIMPSGRSIQSG